MAAVGLTARVVESPDGLDSIHAEWDALAVAAGRPFAAPAWALAWWRHLAPADAALRVLVVEEDGDRLAGVVPLYSTGRAYASLGATMAPVEPVAREGLEAAFAAAAAELLASGAPRPATIELRRHESAPDWAALLARAWPGRGGAWVWTESTIPAPRVEFGDGLEAWLATKSSSFRRDIRRSGRRLEEAGGSFRYATGETLERDVREFLRLHRLRLAALGGSHLPQQGVGEMLAAVGTALLPSGRFRLLCLDLEGETIAANLFLAAGAELSAWNSGFDEEYRDLSPVIQCLLHAMGDASELGASRMSLGAGGQSYKYRLTSTEDPISAALVIPRGPSYPLVKLKLLPRRLRRLLAGRLSSGAKQRLRRLPRLPARRQVR
jgi:CelD/BcsL family acetyltransferase involved in cellulose biosynthesis